MNEEMNIYSNIVKKAGQGKKQFSVLIDPDKPGDLKELIKRAEAADVDYFFIGGSLITTSGIASCVKMIKEKSLIPVVLFPGSTLQITEHADAVLFLALISGRNAELLIGKHVTAAPVVKASKLEVIPTGYMLIDGGKPTTASYISNTSPIPADKDEIAMSTAMAGEMLGMRLIYADAGSGAENAVSESMIRLIKKNITIPLIVGGGIRTAERAAKAYAAGADMVVVGNGIEKDLSLIEKISGKREISKSISSN